MKRLPSLMFIALLGLTCALPASAESGHGEGAGGSVDSSENANIDINVNLGAPGTSDGSGQIDALGNPIAPTSVQNWFDEYSTQKALTEKLGKQQEAASENEESPVIVIETKRVRTSPAKVIAIGTPTSTGTGSKGSGTSSATANISQTIVPNVTVNNVIPNTSPVAAEKIDVGTDNGNDPKSKTNKLSEEEAQLFSSIRTRETLTKIITERASDSRNGKNSGLGAKAAGYSLTRWFLNLVGANGNDSPSTKRKLGRRFIVVSAGDDDAESLSEAAREISGDGRTADSRWFGQDGAGWVGWAVAFLLLFLIVWRTRREMSR